MNEKVQNIANFEHFIRAKYVTSVRFWRNVFHWILVVSVHNEDIACMLSKGT